MTRLRATAILVGVAGLTAAVSGQQAQRAQGTIQSGVRAVLVDVVVHDRKGQPVRDLAQKDFQLTEDGVPQTIASFTPIMEGASGSGTGAAATATTLASTSMVGAAAPVVEGPTVTALVFDRLDAESRKIAVKAAQSYIGSKSEMSGYIGIFGVDLALSPYAPFTRDAAVLKAGLDKMGERATSTSNTKDARDQAATLEQAAQAASASAATAEAAAGAGGSNVGTGMGDALLAQMQANMIRDFDTLERDQQGYASTDGLFAIIEQMRKLSGRKSLVFFSDGLALPTAVVRLFESVKDAANRANVSIYTMDAAGLRAESEQAAIRDQVNGRGAGGGGVLGGGKIGGGPLSQSLENNEDVLRQDPRNGLLGLARDTGGAAFDNTNSLRQGFDRVESDLHNYYMLGYTPKNDKFDGKFRTIDVKVNRPGVTVSSRKGYFGVRDTGSVPVNSWEAPALGLMEATPVPNAFPVRAGAFLFPEAGRPGLTPVVVNFKMAPITFQDSGDGKTLATDFAVIVRFLDGQNGVVSRVSQHYEVRTPSDQLDRAKQGNVVFYREPTLQPGVYTMETIVYDNLSGQASVRFATVEVPKADVHGLRVSSLILTDRVEKVPEQDRKDNPLLVNDLLVYPNLGEAVSKKAKELGFFFTVYPAQGGAAPEAVLQLMTNGKAIGQFPLTLAKADAAGHIRQADRLPIDQLAPGTYELQVVVKQGGASVGRTTTFRLVE